MRRRDFLTTTATVLASSRALAAQRKTKHIDLFTSDGVRWQDLFTGIDPLLNGSCGGTGCVREGRTCDGSRKAFHVDAVFYGERDAEERPI